MASLQTLALVVCFLTAEGSGSATHQQRQHLEEQAEAELHLHHHVSDSAGPAEGARLHNAADRQPQGRMLVRGLLNLLGFGSRANKPSEAAYKREQPAPVTSSSGWVRVGPDGTAQVVPRAALPQED